MYRKVSDMYLYKIRRGYGTSSILKYRGFREIREDAEQRGRKIENRRECYCVSLLYLSLFTVYRLS